MHELGEICFEHDGARLFAVEQGHGLAVIIAHGGLANHQAARLFAAPLADRHRLITPDLRGSGRSVDPRPLSWQRLADDVVALLDHLRIERAVVGGISFGAGVAVATALRHPRRVRALVVLHPAFADAETGLEPQQVAAMQTMDDMGQRTLHDGIAALFPLLDTLPVELRERARATVATYDPASVAATTRLLASGTFPFARAAELHALAVPTLLVPGIDPYHPPSIAAVFRDHVAACTVREVETPALPATIAAFLDELPQS
ncbi:MAG TPA: alpha/beta hydrolase [Kofleriaceae bacterium]|nr:alpha/beta hydrolase [Kofleriaceae bacterium]